MSSPAMMLVLLLPRPLFTQGLVRACTCTITIDITHLQIGPLKIQAERFNLHAAFRSPGNREQPARLIGIDSSMSVSVL
jgi:hypothetical protein